MCQGQQAAPGQMNTQGYPQSGLPTTYGNGTQQRYGGLFGSPSGGMTPQYGGGMSPGVGPGDLTAPPYNPANDAGGTISSGSMGAGSFVNPGALPQQTFDPSQFQQMQGGGRGFYGGGAMTGGALRPPPGIPGGTPGPTPGTLGRTNFPPFTGPGNMGLMSGGSGGMFASPGRGVMSTGTGAMTGASQGAGATGALTSGGDPYAQFAQLFGGRLPQQQANPWGNQGRMQPSWVTPPGAGGQPPPPTPPPGYGPPPPGTPPGTPPGGGGGGGGGSSWEQNFTPGMTDAQRLGVRNANLAGWGQNWDPGQANPNFAPTQGALQAATAGGYTSQPYQSLLGQAGNQTTLNSAINNLSPGGGGYNPGVDPRFLNDPHANMSAYGLHWNGSQWVK